MCGRGCGGGGGRGGGRGPGNGEGGVVGRAEQAVVVDVAEAVRWRTENQTGSARDARR